MDMLKVCCKCKGEKPLSDYYSKGSNKIDARCKLCVLEAKKNKRDSEILERKKLKAETKEPVRETEYDYEIDENGKILFKIIIHCPDLFNKRATAERALELYHQNLSFEEICSSMDRSDRWVRQSLAKYGVSLGDKDNRKDVQNVPYGWKLNNGKLNTVKSEQWLLHKVEDDLKSGLNLKDVSANLNQLNIKAPKSHPRWNEDLLSKVIKMNKRLKVVLPEAKDIAHQTPSI